LFQPPGFRGSQSDQLALDGVDLLGVLVQVEAVPVGKQFLVLGG